MFSCHGVLLGLLNHREDWVVVSNVESGDGYSDILIESGEDNIGVVIEVKYAENGNFEKACQEAMEQIDRMEYGDSLLNEGMEHVYKYGAACFKMKCKMLLTCFPPLAKSAPIFSPHIEFPLFFMYNLVGENTFYEP